MGQDRPHPEGRQEGMGRVAQRQHASTENQKRRGWAAGPSPPLGFGAVHRVFQRLHGPQDSSSSTAICPTSGNPVAIVAQRRCDQIDHRQTRTPYIDEPFRINGRSKPALTFSLSFRHVERSTSWQRSPPSLNTFPPSSRQTSAVACSLSAQPHLPTRAHCLTPWPIPLLTHLPKKPLPPRPTNLPLRSSTSSPSGATSIPTSPPWETTSPRLPSRASASSSSPRCA